MSLFLSRRYFDRRFDAIEGALKKIMASQQDLDQALTDFETAQDAATAEINQAVQDILAKVPSVDLSAEVGRLQAAQQKQQQAADAIKALDVGPTPAPTPSPTPGGRRA